MKLLSKDFADQLKKGSLLQQWIDSQKIVCRHKNIEDADRPILIEKLKEIKLKKHSQIDVSGLFKDDGRVKEFIEQLKEKCFSVFNIEDKLFGFQTSKEIQAFIDANKKLVEKYKSLVEENQLIQLLVPLTSIKLEEWDNEAKSKLAVILDKFSKQKEILYQKEKEKEKAEQERLAKLKAEEEAEKARQAKIRAEQEAERAR